MNSYTGEIVNATCEAIQNDRVIARFHASELASIPREQWAAEVGDETEIYIDGILKNGLWVGSRDKIKPIQIWEKLTSAKENQTDLEAKVIAAKENGLVCDVETLRGWMPKWEIEESPMGALEYYVGKTLKARILKFSESDASLTISHKAAIAESVREGREKLLIALQSGQTYLGIVRQITDYGVFVDIGSGVEGLVHRSNLSWNNADPATVVSIGDTIEVKVLSSENGKIALDRKSLLADPWEEVVQKLKVGDVLDGKVTTFTNYGAFVQIANGVEGLVHISEISWDKTVREPSKILKLNQKIQVRLIGIDAQKHRIRLSYKRVQENPWQAFAEKNPVGTILTQKIASIAEFGIFVELDNGLHGLIPRHDLSDVDKNTALSTKYHVGDEIECVVSEIDVERMRIGLKPHGNRPDPYRVFFDSKPLGQQFEAKILRTTKFGAFASIGEVEGLIHISELSDKRVDRVESVVKPGQTVTVTVIKIDESKKRIGLSMTADSFSPENEQESFVSAPENRPTFADIFPKLRP